IGFPSRRRSGRQKRSRRHPKSARGVALPSAAFTDHLLRLLEDVERLREIHARLPGGVPGRPGRRAALNRATVVLALPACEGHVEELVRLPLDLLRPPAPPLGVWSALNASVRAQLGRFNTPNPDNVRMLISDAIGRPPERPGIVDLAELHLGSGGPT